MGSKSWVTLIIQCPVAEDGGPDGTFTYDVKIQELTSSVLLCGSFYGPHLIMTLISHYRVLKCLWAVSWSFERVGRAVPWLSREIQKLRQRRDAFWLAEFLEKPHSGSEEPLGGSGSGDILVGEAEDCSSAASGVC